MNRRERKRKKKKKRVTESLNCAATSPSYLLTASRRDWFHQVRPMIRAKFCFFLWPHGRPHPGIPGPQELEVPDARLQTPGSMVPNQHRPTGNGRAPELDGLACRHPARHGAGTNWGAPHLRRQTRLGDANLVGPWIISWRLPSVRRNPRFLDFPSQPNVERHRRRLVSIASPGPASVSSPPWCRVIHFASVETITTGTSHSLTHLSTIQHLKHSRLHEYADDHRLRPATIHSFRTPSFRSFHRARQPCAALFNSSSLWPPLPRRARPAGPFG